jgi:hypothetical protein
MSMSEFRSLGQLLEDGIKDMSSGKAASSGDTSASKAASSLQYKPISDDYDFEEEISDDNDDTERIVDSANDPNKTADSDKLVAETNAVEENIKSANDPAKTINSDKLVSETNAVEENIKSANDPDKTAESDKLVAESLRLGRKINKALQRSDMNPYLKPYFKETSIQAMNENGHIMVALNSTAINNEDTFEEIGDTRYFNNMKYLKENVDKILKQEGYEGRYILAEATNSDELFNYKDTYKNKYTQCVLMLAEGDSPTIEKATTMNDTLPWEERNNRGLKININQSDYYKMFRDQGGGTTRELKAEVAKNNSDTYLSNALDINKLGDHNQSHSDKPFDATMVYESVDFINNLSDEEKFAIYNYLKEDGIILK